MSIDPAPAFPSNGVEDRRAFLHSPVYLGGRWATSLHIVFPQPTSVTPLFRSETDFRGLASPPRLAVRVVGDRFVASGVSYQPITMINFPPFPIAPDTVETHCTRPMLVTEGVNGERFVVVRSRCGRLERGIPPCEIRRLRIDYQIEHFGVFRHAQGVDISRAGIGIIEHRGCYIRALVDNAVVTRKPIPSKRKARVGIYVDDPFRLLQPRRSPCRTDIRANCPLLSSSFQPPHERAYILPSQSFARTNPRGMLYEPPCRTDRTPRKGPLVRERSDSSGNRRMFASSSP